MNSGTRSPHIRALSLSFFLCLAVACTEKETLLPEHLGGQIYQGKARFDVKCYGCHGWMGEGSMHAPALAKNGEIIPYFEFYSAVTYGRGGVMPAYNRVLGEREIRLLMDWLQQVSMLSAGTGK